MIEQPATQADKRALIQRGKIEERRQDETVNIDSPIAVEQDGVWRWGGTFRFDLS